jgi:hypothetical protein
MFCKLKNWRRASQPDMIATRKAIYPVSHLLP